MKHTSVVIRDEFYALANKERADVFEEAEQVAEEIVKEGDSSFFSDTLDAQSLKSLTDGQLDDLEKTQEGDLNRAKEGLREIDKRIDDVDSGDYFGNWFWWKNQDAEDVENLRKELKSLRCPDRNIPEKDSGNRASEKVEDIMDQLDAKIEDLENRFLGNAFGSDFVNPDTEDPEGKRIADLQKRAYDMKVTDRQIQTALDQMSDEEKAEAEANGTLPKKMIEYYYQTEDQIKREIRSSGLVEEGSEEFNEMVAQEVEKMDNLKRTYDQCDVAFLDDGTEDETTITAYDGAKQLRSLAESKMETFKLKELAIDNLVEIEEARKLKQEELQDNQ
jgi:hypothetical protein